MASMTREEAQKSCLDQLQILDKNPKFVNEKNYRWFTAGGRADRKDRLAFATSYLDEAYPNAKKQQLTVNVRIWALKNGYLNIDSLEKCKECGENYAILSYKKNIKQVTFSDACCRKCSQKLLAKKQSSEEFIQKKKDTAIKNYGSEKAAYIDTMSKTVKAKYDVDNISQAKVCKEKKIETSRERYGTDFPWQTEEGKSAQKRGVRMKHGVDNVSKVPEVKQKKIETTQQHYGVDNPFQADEVKEKIKETNMKQFGVENPAQRECQRKERHDNILEHRKHSDDPLAWGYSKKACKIIQQFNDLWGYNFQHAENGGEYRVPHVDYLVDGYDAQRNIVIEIDEKHHFENGKLKDKDIERQQIIENVLNCKFIRIKYF